jgi:hypothetical protein
VVKKAKRETISFYYRIKNIYTMMAGSRPYSGDVRFDSNDDSEFLDAMFAAEHGNILISSQSQTTKVLTLEPRQLPTLEARELPTLEARELPTVEEPEHPALELGQRRRVTFK